MVARGKGQLRSLGRSCTHCYIQNGKATKIYCITQKNLLSVMCQPGWEQGWRKMGTCICMTKSHCSSSETTTILLIGYAQIQNKFKSLREKITSLWKILHNTIKCIQNCFHFILSQHFLVLCMYVSMPLCITYTDAFLQKRNSEHNFRYTGSILAVYLPRRSTASSSKHYFTSYTGCFNLTLWTESTFPNLLFSKY